jgi:hypothetical protein
MPTAVGLHTSTSTLATSPHTHCTGPVSTALILAAACRAGQGGEALANYQAALPSSKNSAGREQQSAGRQADGPPARRACSRLALKGSYRKGPLP